MGLARPWSGGWPGGPCTVLWPTQRLLWTREGVVYVVIWLVLLVLGLHQQINLILLVAGLAAGPVVGVVRGQRGDAPAAAGVADGAAPTSSPATRSRSITRWRTPGDGPRRWR